MIVERSSVREAQLKKQPCSSQSFSHMLLLCDSCGSLFMLREMIRCRGYSPDGHMFTCNYCLSCVDFRLMDIMFEYAFRQRYG